MTKLLSVLTVAVAAIAGLFVLIVCILDNWRWLMSFKF